MAQVSVILPFHNAADTLSAAVESIIGQTFEDWRLIMFSDGADDKSLEQARTRAWRDKRIRVIVSDHVGLVEALRRACSEAEGELIARMDADDVAKPPRLELQFAHMRQNPRVALCGARVRVTGARVGPGLRRYESWINSVLTPREIVRELFIECPIPHPTFMMRRDAFERVGGYRDRGWPEDYDLCMRFIECGYRLGKVDACLLEWRDRPGRLSMVDPRYSPKAFRALKRHYLPRMYPAVRKRFYQWGAGEVGKRWLREWGEQSPVAVVDVNPRKIGRCIHGVPVIAPDELPPPGETFVAVAVGAPGARSDIRAWFEPREYEEAKDFLFIA